MSSNHTSITNIRRFFPADASSWKLLAALSMLIDHLSVALFHTKPLDYYAANEFAIPSAPLYLLMRGIGRIAFPIFAYFLVEGYYKTSNFSKHLTRMLVFACLSELPFNCLVGKTFFYPYYQNVLITFSLALIMMRLSDFIHTSIMSEQMKGDILFSAISRILIVFVFASFGYLLHTDYGMDGIILIALIHGFYGKFQLPLYSGNYGNRRINKIMYYFYPVHLFILGIIFSKPF